MRSLKLAFCALLVWVAWYAGAGRAFGHSDIGSDKGGDLAALAERSNLVFIGRVANVEYRRSEKRAGEGGGLPHTIVTYEIGSVLRGQPYGKTFMMRFIGGSDGAGRFMEVSGVPMFQLGEEDLLFVSGNGERVCPLVLCEWGRFRILRGGVYNHHGFPVRAVRKTNAIARGMPPKEFLTFRYPAPRFDDLVKNAEVRALMERQKMSLDEIRRRYEAEAPKQIELGRDIPAAIDKDSLGEVQQAERSAIATTPDAIPEGPMAVEEFTTVLKSILGHTKRAPSPIRSIARDAPIIVAPAKASAPHRPVPARAEAAPRSKEEAAELAAAKKQDFDPVLKPR